MGCGHPATEAECEQILERAARLELKERLGSSDESVIEKEVTATKSALRESMMNDCVGKRITEEAMECIRAATTADEMFGDCFR